MIEGYGSRVAAESPGRPDPPRVQWGVTGWWNEAGGTNGWLGSDPGAVAVIAVIAVLGACSAATPGGGSQKQVIGFSQANGSDEWRTNQNKKVAENCNPVAQTLVSDALGDDAVQSSHVDEFVSRPVSVLLLTPNTAAGLTEAAKRALDKKVPVITLDRSVDVEVTQHIGADNKLIGKTAAEYVSKTILGGAVARSSRSRARPAPRRRPTATTSS